MASEIDVYRKWLGIKSEQRPPDHYELLRLPKFEDDSAKIRKHYRKVNEHIRQFATGEHAKQSQDLLNELARAMLCLTDARRKAEYDASIGREQTASTRRRSFEELLLLRKVVTKEQLDRARKFADATGVELRDALVQQKAADADTVVPIYAESQGLPYVDWSEVQMDLAIVDLVPAVIARKHSVAPVLIEDGQLILASPHLLAQDVEDELRLRTGKPIRTSVCTTQGINKIVEKFYPAEKIATEAAAARQATGAKPIAGKGPAAVSSLTPEEKAAATKQRLMLSFALSAFAFFGVMAFYGFQGTMMLWVLGAAVFGVMFAITYVGQQLMG
jgi:hypothetical protein